MAFLLSVPRAKSMKEESPLFDMRILGQGWNMVLLVSIWVLIGVSEQFVHAMVATGNVNFP